MATAKFIAEIKPGPAVRAVLDIADVAERILEFMPEWHASERDELRGLLEGAKVHLTNALTVRPAKTSEFEEADDW